MHTLKSLFQKISLLSVCIFFVCSLGLSNFLYSQVERESPPPSISNKKQTDGWKPKLQLGGNFGFQFGTYTCINVSPQIGTYVTDWLLAGVGVSYMYVNQVSLYSCHVMGGNIFLQPTIFNRILIHAEYEYQYIIQNDKYYGITDHYDNHNIVVGAGYRYYINDITSIYGLILINAYQSYWSNDYNPFFRIGINIDL